MHGWRLTFSFYNFSKMNAYWTQGMGIQVDRINTELIRKMLSWTTHIINVSACSGQYWQFLGHINFGFKKVDFFNLAPFLVIFSYFDNLKIEMFELQNS